MDALKAQACAARAFALGNKQPGKSWDVYCDVRDQAYMGIGIEKTRTSTAVKETAGVCPTYNGKPIVAVYFSCSGGETEDVKYVWGGGTYPYLKGVDDPYFDGYATLHDWGPLRRTPSQPGDPLGAAGSLRAVYTLKRGTSPRIVKAAIIGSGGTKYIDGGSLRVKLGLNSAWVVFTSMGISMSGSRRREHQLGVEHHAQRAHLPGPRRGRARCTCTDDAAANGAAAASPPRASPRACPAATRRATRSTARR